MSLSSGCAEFCCADAKAPLVLLPSAPSADAVDHRAAIVREMKKAFDSSGPLTLVGFIEIVSFTGFVLGVLCFAAGLVLSLPPFHLPSSELLGFSGLVFAIISMFAASQVPEGRHRRDRSPLARFAFRCALELEGSRPGDPATRAQVEMMHDRRFRWLRSKYRRDFELRVQTRDRAAVVDAQARARVALAEARGRELADYRSEVVGVVPDFDRDESVSVAVDSRPFTIPQDLPSEATFSLERISALSVKGQGGSAYGRDAFVLREVARRYVPDTLAAWRADDRPDADVELIDQLGMIEGSAAAFDCGSSASISPLAQNRRFLESSMASVFSARDHSQ